MHEHHSPVKPEYTPRRGIDAPPAGSHAVEMAMQVMSTEGMPKAEIDPIIHSVITEGKTPWAVLITLPNGQYHVISNREFDHKTGKPHKGDGGVDIGAYKLMNAVGKAAVARAKETPSTESLPPEAINDPKIRALLEDDATAFIIGGANYNEDTGITVAVSGFDPSVDQEYANEIQKRLTAHLMTLSAKMSQKSRKPINGFSLPRRAEESDADIAELVERQLRKALRYV